MPSGPAASKSAHIRLATRPRAPATSMATAPAMCSGSTRRPATPTCGKSWTGTGAEAPRSDCIQRDGPRPASAILTGMAPTMSCGSTQRPATLTSGWSRTAAGPRVSISATNPLGWSPAGIGDFDHNGTADILWREGGDQPRRGVAVVEWLAEPRDGSIREQQIVLTEDRDFGRLVYASAVPAHESHPAPISYEHARLLPVRSCRIRCQPRRPDRRTVRGH